VTTRSKSSEIGRVEVVSERPRVSRGHEVRTIVGSMNLRRRVAVSSETQS
jgi:hypothetical protein